MIRSNKHLTQKTVAQMIKRRDPRLLGLKKKPQPLNHNFRLRAPVKLPTLQTKAWPAPAKTPWDQGQTSMCVSFGTNALLASSPTRNSIPPKSSKLNLWAWLEWFYQETQKRDEWDGTDYDGTSVWGAMKFLLELGYIESYWWAYDIDTIVNYVLTVGPMVVGTDWTNPMFETLGSSVKNKAFSEFIQVSPTGRYDVAGGHCYLIIGVDRKRKCPDGTVGAFRILNSWGKSFGMNGRAWISFKDFAILLANSGEAACVVEKMLTAPKAFKEMMKAA